MKKLHSVLTNDLSRCFLTGRTPVHIHHVFGAFNRKKSEQDGFIVPLAPELHNMSNEGVHFNRKLDLFFKELCQTYYEKRIGSREDFIVRYGKSYL